MGPLWYRLFPVLFVPAPAGDRGIRRAQPPGSAALVGLAVVDHGNSGCLDRPGEFSSDWLVPSINHSDLWGCLPAFHARLGHRRDG